MHHELLQDRGVPGPQWLRGRFREQCAYRGGPPGGSGENLCGHGCGLCRGSCNFHCLTTIYTMHYLLFAAGLFFAIGCSTPTAATQGETTAPTTSAAPAPGARYLVYLLRRCLGSNRTEHPRWHRDRYHDPDRNGRRPRGKLQFRRPGDRATHRDGHRRWTAPQLLLHRVPD